MRSTESDGVEVSLTARLLNAFDGLARLLGDVERFGFGLLHVDLVAREGHDADLRLTLRLPPGADAAQVCRRFARHASVLSVEFAR